MNLIKIILKGVLLGLIFILCFCFIYWFKKNNIFKYNLIFVSFIFPVISVIFIFYQFKKLKFKKKNLYFINIMLYTYLIQIFSAIFSITCIYIFMNFIDIKTRNLFNYQWADLNYKNAKNEILFQNNHFKKLNKIENNKQKYLILKTLKSIRNNHKINFFSFQENLFIFFMFGILIYSAILSLFLSLIIKNNFLFKF